MPDAVFNSLQVYEVTLPLQLLARVDVNVPPVESVLPVGGLRVTVSVWVVLKGAQLIVNVIAKSEAL